jgi:hypothetical protein
MARTPYLAVRNWERYQHYKDGRPVIWIKLYVSLLDDPELRALPPETRLLWDQLLLLAARTDNVLRRDWEWIAACTSLDTKSVQTGVQLLLKGAWLRQFDSRRSLELTRARERARSRAEREVLRTSLKNALEQRAHTSRARSSAKNQNPPPAVCRECEIGGGLHTADCSLAKIDEVF